MEDAKERLFSKRKIDTITGCWEFTGKPKKNGYCRITFKRKSWYAHRLSYTAFVGDIPKDLVVCHKCDNPLCFNPGHLFLGTPNDNIQDAVAKGRIAKGFMLPQTKLSDEDREKIIERALSGELYKSIAKYFNVTRHLIGYIAKNAGHTRYNVK